MIDELEGFVFSASGIKTRRACKRKAGHVYIQGLRGPTSGGAKLGKEIHAELEHWSIKRKPPTIPTARRFIPLIPSPAHPDLKIEHEFRILLPPGAAHGFIDVLVTEPDSRYMPQGSTWDRNRPVVFDHKSTARIEFALTSKDLITDPQAILYGLAARVEKARELDTKAANIPDVDLVWNYVQTKGQPLIKVTRLRQTLPILEEGLGTILQEAKEFAAEVAHGKVEDLDYDLRECDRYGGCPHKPYCTAHQAYVSGSSPSPANDGAYASSMTSSLLLKLKKASETPPKADPDMVFNSETPASTPASTTGNVKPSPEPDLPKPDTSGLDVAPDEPIEILPPDSAPNVTPDDPSPGVVIEAEAIVVKRPRGRPKKVAEPEPVAIIASGHVSDKDMLENLIHNAVDNGEYNIAQHAIELLSLIKERG